ncbi:hypothetical protein MRB53_023516 [Persea americana]|uniref:Uncharacterized protein n=1 Tax=Persea americana TaxID=3435 RepID=A0ACC2LAU5_PERAE|nr:hypothetical protein MRB53_023516 [Persea americana]
MHKLEVLLLDMAPKKKRPCHRDSFDRARFLNEDGQNFFLNKYQHHSVVPEQIVMYNELHDTDFCLWMQQRGWFTLYDVGYHIVVNWVREFYSNMHGISDNSFKTYVRGQELDITPDLLSQVLEIDRVEGAHFPIVKNRQINYNLIYRFTLEKSRSHITAVELDDGGEGDRTSPSGVGPSGVGPSIVAYSDEGNSGDDQIGEVAINALNDRIGRLEVRVNEGFTEMRQGFAEMLDRLRCD